METCQRQHHSWLAQKDAASGIHGERHRDRPVMEQHESWAFRWEPGVNLAFPAVSHIALHGKGQQSLILHHNMVNP